MNPEEIIKESRKALGVEQGQISRTLKAISDSKERKRKRPSSVLSVNQRMNEYNRELVRKTWKRLIFSVAFSALHPDGDKRTMGPNEKKARTIMANQHKKISLAIQSQTFLFGESGKMFNRMIVGRYRRSVIDVKVEPMVGGGGLGGGLGEGDDDLIENSIAPPNSQAHCEIAKHSISLSSARKVNIRYRGKGGLVHDAKTMIVSEEWSNRIQAWFDIILADIHTRNKAKLLYNNEDFKIPDEILIRWKGSNIGSLSDIVSQDDELFNRYSHAITTWLDNSTCNHVWNGWFG